MSQIDSSREDDDPYQWLEDLDSAEARAWVEARNAETQAALCDQRFEQDRRTLLDLLNADDRIPWINQCGDAVYNFWQDAAHPKGIWRRTTLADYRNAEPRWETVLDLDALAREEGEDWVWHGCVAQPPEYRRGLVQLSRGGADAIVVREFDLAEKRFIAEGFTLPEAKGSADWLDPDRLLVATALGGASFETTSGYARTVRLWRRGTPFGEAPIVFEGAREHMFVSGWRNHQAARPRTFYMRGLDFIRHELLVEEAPGALRKVEVPLDAVVAVRRDWLIVNLRSDWAAGDTTYPAGALLVIDFDAFMAGGRDFTVLFEPRDRCFLQGFDLAGGAIALQLLDNVRSRLVLARHRDGVWRSVPLTGFPGEATLDIRALDSDDSNWFLAPDEEGDDFLVLAHNTVMPPTLSLARFGEAPEPLKQAPPALRCNRPGDHAARGAIGRWHPRSVFPDRPRRPCARRFERGPAHRLRRLRDRPAAVALAGPRQALAGARRCQCHRQYPRRRRVRAGLAQGRHPRRQESGARRFRRGRKRLDRTRGDATGPARRLGRQQWRAFGRQHAHPLR